MFNRYPVPITCGLLLLAGVSIILLSGCKSQKSFDASGSFEAEKEVIVSSEQNGRLLRLNADEGSFIPEGAIVGRLDVKGLELQKEQKEAALGALPQRLYDPMPQLELIRRQYAVQLAQLSEQQKEEKRFAGLLSEGAATRKQVDDISYKIEQLKKSLLVTRQQLTYYASTIATQNRSVMSEKSTSEKAVAIAQHEIDKGQVFNPVSGTVLTQYAYAGEYATIGKPLYKIANLSDLILRAYISGNQLASVRLGQSVKVYTDDGKGGMKRYHGTISFISSQAEFTPKTIETKDERADMVYAVKIRVPNDGYLKIGMYGEVKF